MPYNLFIDRNRGLVRITARGAVLDDEIARCAEAVPSNPHFGSNLHWLFDCTVVEELQISLFSLSTLAESRRSGKLAFVGPKEFCNEVSRLHAMLAKIQTCGEFAAFTNREVAIKWLAGSSPKQILPPRWSERRDLVLSD